MPPRAPLRERWGLELQQLAEAGQLCPLRAGAEPGRLPVQGPDLLQVRRVFFFNKYRSYCIYVGFSQPNLVMTSERIA